MKLEYKAQMTIAEIGQMLCRQRCSIYAVDHYRSRVRAIQGTDYLQQCGLTSSTGSHYAHHLALVYMEVDTLQYL